MHCGHSKAKNENFHRANTQGIRGKASGDVGIKIENKKQYDWAVARVEQLLPLVSDDAPADDPNLTELEQLSNLVADYSEVHYALDNPTHKKELMNVRRQLADIVASELIK